MYPIYNSVGTINGTERSIKENLFIILYASAFGAYSYPLLKTKNDVLMGLVVLQLLNSTGNKLDTVSIVFTNDNALH